jgi:hypothetical protein
VALHLELLKLTFGTQRDRTLSQIGNSKLSKIKLKATVPQDRVSLDILVQKLTIIEANCLELERKK